MSSHPLPGGCVAELASKCSCLWEAEKSKAPLQGLVKAGSSATQDANKCTAGDNACAEASASAASCEAWCCHGQGGEPPTVTSAPAEPLRPATGPCGAWQWAPGTADALLDHAGCWVGVQPSLQQLPHNENGGGAWIGAQGNLGSNSGWGVTVLLIFFITTLSYGVVFAGLRWKQGNRGSQLIPHRQFWTELAGMVHDGVNLTVYTCTGTRRQVRPNGSRGKRSQHKQKPKSKPSKRRNNQSKDTKRDDNERLLAATVDTAPVSQATNTKAGDGGRWVHVPG